MSLLSQSNPRGNRRQNLIRALAFFAVAMLAALAVHGVYYNNVGSASGIHGSASEGSAAYDPVTVAENHGDALKTIAARSVDADALANEAWAEADEAVMTAESQALFLKDRATAFQVPHVDLPALPDAYLPGVPVDVTVEVPAYTVPDVTAGGVSDLDAFEAAWVQQALALAENSSELPPEYHQALDSAEDMADDELVAVLIGALNEIAGASGAPVVVPEVSTEPLRDPAGLVQPDDDAAQAAYEHAMGLLGDAEALVGTGLDSNGAMGAYLAWVEAHQSDLVGIVESTVEETRALETAAAADLLAQVDADINATLEAANEKINKADAQLSAAKGTIAEAKADAVADLDAAEARLKDARADAEAVAADLRARADTIDDDTDVLILETRAQTEQTLAQLEALEAQGHDVSAQMDAVQAASAEAEADLRAAAADGAALLRAEADSIEQYARAELGDLESTIDDARAQLTADVDAAVSDLEARAQYAGDLARAEASATAEALVAAGGEAVGQLHGDVDAHLNAVWMRALEVNAQAYTVLDGVEAVGFSIVEDVQLPGGANLSMVSEDADMIREVIEDYKARGGEVTGEAAEWQAALDEVEGLQSQVDSAVWMRIGQVSQVEAVLDDVAGQLLTVSLI